ncbi:hypothetical protein OG389_00855 [Streptomyces sp. NBC_00435]|uniref:hypothetical protein n=1 Tax=Streptomyces sp. NBC_00435 TaxID=2903649 RepID=UPI002E22EFC1
MDADTVNRELPVARKAIGWWQRQGWIERALWLVAESCFLVRENSLLAEASADKVGAARAGMGGTGCPHRGPTRRQRDPWPADADGRAGLCSADTEEAQ